MLNMANGAYFLVIVIFIQFGGSLQQQQKLKQLRKDLNYLELLISRETFKTRTDIAELRDTINRINRTGDFGGDESLTLTDSSVLDAALAKLESEMKEVSKWQNIKITQMARAISTEKKLTRQRMKELDILAENAVIDSIDDIKTDLNETKEANSKLSSEVQEVKQENQELRRLITNLQETVAKGGNAGMVPVKQPPCPDKWMKFQDMCYLYVKDEKASWHAAEFRCIDHGGILAEPDTEEKMRYLLGVVENNVWIGATDDETEGTWVWSSSQKPVQFTLWEPGQPNSYGGNQDCMEKGMGQLNDENCMHEGNYVCEKKANV